MEGRTPLSELARLFLRLGSTSFGGPAVHIAMMEDEVVRRRAWLTHQQFLDMVAATNLIPGPNSTEMAIHIGYRQAGFKGLMISGISFISPAVLLVSGIAWLYVRYGNIPLANGLLYGIKPVILAVLVQAVWRLGQSVLKNGFLAGMACLIVFLNLAGLGELSLLLLAALTSAIVFPFLRERAEDANSKSFCLASPAIFTTVPGIFSVPPILGGLSAAASIHLGQLFLVFLKAGAALFGSGYVLLAFLRTDLVVKLGWLTEAQLLDAIAIGQITPGPVFTTATFIGYLLSGPSGALIATIGIFLPAFFFVALSAPLLPYLRRSVVAARILDGLNVASLALMAVVTVGLARAAVVDWTTTCLLIIAAVSLLRWNINSTWLVLTSGLVGMLITALL